MKIRFAFALVASALCLTFQTGCGGSSDPVMIEQPTEDFLEEIRLGQQQYAKDMADSK